MYHVVRADKRMSNAFGGYLGIGHGLRAYFDCFEDLAIMMKLPGYSTALGICARFLGRSFRVLRSGILQRERC